MASLLAELIGQSKFEVWLAWHGIATGVLLIVGSLEFVGIFERRDGISPGAIVPFTYTASSLGLVVTGIVLFAA
jgi:hypothetical protein